MAAPTISGGFTMLEDCQTGNPEQGITPSAVLSGSTPTTAPNRFSRYGTALNATGGGFIGNNNTGNALRAGIYALSSPADLSVSNRLLAVHSSAFPDTGVGDLTASSGVMLYCNSSSLGSEEAAFPIWGADALVPSNFSVAVVNVNRSADAYLYGVNFDPADVTHVGLASNWQAGYIELDMDSFGYVDPYIILEGDATTPGDFSYIISKINSDDTKMSESPTGNLHHCFFAWGVGNGTDTVYVRETLKTFEFARAVDFSEPWGRAHINDNDLGFPLNAASDTDVIYELCNWVSETPFYWNSIGNTSPTQVKYISCVIQNAGDLTIVDGHEFIGTTFDSCATISANNPTFTNSSIKNASGVALDLDSGAGANITNTTFSGNQTAIRVDVAGNATLDVRGCNFDSDNTYYIEYTGTGTLTVTTDDGIAAGKLNASGGGTIDAEKTVTVSVTCKDASDNSNIQDARVFLKAGPGGPLPSEASVTITRSGSTATVTHTAHGLSNGDQVVVEGADQDEYNGTKTISNVTANTYDYTVSGTPASPATGTIISSFLVVNQLSSASGFASGTFTFTSDQPYNGYARKPSGPIPYTQALISGTATSNGDSNTVLMIRRI